MNVASRRRAIFSGLLVLGATLPVGGQDRFPDSPPNPARAARTQPVRTVEPAPPLGPTAPDPGRNAPPPGPTNPDARPAQATSAEGEDFGVEPTDQLRGDPLHAPTPTRIPGARVISTADLQHLLEGSPGTFIVFDVLNGAQGLPGAQNARPAGNGGTFDDQTQRDFGTYLQQVTKGNKDVPLIFYCQNTHCWMSYNAALRAAHLGYARVHWYRGGIEAWQQAGLPTYSRQF